jgi:hypothetical protein
LLGWKSNQGKGLYQLRKALNVPPPSKIERERKQISKLNKEGEGGEQTTRNQ